MTPWLSVVGIGEDGLAGLSAAARTLVDTAEVLIGGERHLALVPADGRERLVWPSPLTALVEEIMRRRGRPLCVLASGDPMDYGIGVTLARQIDPAEMTVIPAPGAGRGRNRDAARPAGGAAECLYPARRPAADPVGKRYDSGGGGGVAARARLWRQPDGRAGTYGRAA
jgi:hypothetical protein